MQSLIFSNFVSKMPRTSRLNFLPRFLTHLFFSQPLKPYTFQTIILPIKIITETIPSDELRKQNYAFFLLIHSSCSLSMNPCNVCVMRRLSLCPCRITFPTSQKALASAQLSGCTGSFA